MGQATFRKIFVAVHVGGEWKPVPRSWQSSLASLPPVGRRHGKWVVSTFCVSEASIASCSSRGIRVARVWSSPGVAPEESAVYFL